MGEVNKYSAVPSALGYLYQLRLGLLNSLKKLKEETPFTISLETLDDIEIETSEDSRELIQAKHKLDSKTNLTDASEDLWKTIRIWCEGIKTGNIPKDSIFFLVTTESAPSGNAVYYLKDSQDRDVDTAIERLNSTAHSSSSQRNQPGYKAFNALNPKELKAMFRNVYVLDSSPSIGELENLIRRELYHLAENKFLNSVIERLEGWWFKRVIDQMLLKRPSILSEEIMAETGCLREQFKTDNLPVDDDIINAEIDATGYQDTIFVKQLELIGISKKRIFFAIQDYYRAFTQRSRWMREKLLYVGELERYEKRLIEEWNLFFEQTYDSLEIEADEESKVRLGKQLYKWIESNMHPQIRKEVTHPSISRGSYHMLSDDLKVGWHNEFKERLQHLLQTASTGN